MFKSGDRVVLKKDENIFHKGETGTIREVQPSGWIVVDVDEPHGGFFVTWEECGDIELLLNR